MLTYHFFVPFWMLNNMDLTFVTRSIEDGVGASARFGTVSGGKMVTELKKHVTIQETKEFATKLAE